MKLLRFGMWMRPQYVLIHQRQKYWARKENPAPGLRSGKENITCLAAGSAKGQKIPPLIIYKGLNK